MRLRNANIIRVFAVWTVFVWVTRIKNVFTDSAHTGIGFRAVHVLLALISIALAGAAWVAVRRERRGRREVAE